MFWLLQTFSLVEKTLMFIKKCPCSEAADVKFVAHYGVFMGI